MILENQYAKIILSDENSEVIDVIDKKTNKVITTGRAGGLHCPLRAICWPSL